MSDETTELVDETIPEIELPAAVRLQVRMDGHDRDRSLGHLGVAWIEHFVKHGFGDVEGQDVVFDDDFYNTTVDAYCLYSTGRRLYQTVVVSRPKGTAKSEWAGYTAMFDAMGPSRFAGWAKGGEVYRQGNFTYVYAKGEPMGRRLSSPFIRMLATEEQQVIRFYNAVIGYNLDPSNGAEISTFPGVERFDTFAKLPDGGRVEPSTAGAASKDGGNESLALFDEPHLYVTPQLRQMYDTVDRNLPKRKSAEPWALLVSTMYADGEDSVLERMHRLALLIQEGEVPNPGLLFDHIEAGVITDLSDEDRLRAVLKGVYADRDWIDYDRYVMRALDPTKDPSDFRRYTLNQRGAAATAYLSPVEVSALTAEPVLPLKRGEAITLGYDYAPGNTGTSTHKRKFRIPDSTALIAVRLSDMTIHKIGLWEAPETAAAEGWNPPDAEIDAAFDEAFKLYNVVGLWADPSHDKARLDRLTAKHLRTLKVKASLDRPTYRYMSGKSAAWMSRQITDFYEAIATGSVRMVADPALMRHFVNARRVVGTAGIGLYKRNPDSPLKIDALISAILAWSCAVSAQNKGVGQTTDIPRTRFPRNI